MLLNHFILYPSSLRTKIEKLYHALRKIICLPSSTGHVIDSGLDKHHISTPTIPQHDTPHLLVNWN